MIILSHPTGNANVRAVLEAFARKDALESYSTTLASHPQSLISKVGLSSIYNELQRRSYSNQINPYIQDYPIPEIVRLLATKLNLKFLTRHETGKFSVDGIYRYLDKKVSESLEKNKNSNVKGVYAYEDGALETFRIAKKEGITTFYDLPIAYWETGSKLMKEESERYPLWSKTLAGGIKDSPEKLARKTKELELADVVIGPGSFVMDSLPKWAQAKTRII